MHRIPLAACLLASLLAGCASTPVAPETPPPDAAPPAPGPDAHWRVVRDFNFTVTDGEAVPGGVVGTSHTAYEHLPYDCTLFDLPGTVSTLTIWLNSTPDNLAEPSVGGVTFDLRHDSGDALLGSVRSDPTQAAPRSYTLQVKGDLTGHYLVNYKAENAAYHAHARAQVILEGQGTLQGDGPMAGCKDISP
jgi:hypothetical protein